MTGAAIGVPLDVDVGVGDNWDEAHRPGAKRGMLGFWSDLPILKGADCKLHLVEL